MRGTGVRDANGKGMYVLDTDASDFWNSPSRTGMEREDKPVLHLEQDNLNDERQAPAQQNSAT